MHGIRWIERKGERILQVLQPTVYSHGYGSQLEWHDVPFVSDAEWTFNPTEDQQGE